MSEAKRIALKEAHHLLHAQHQPPTASARWQKLRMAVQVTGAFKAASRERLLSKQRESDRAEEEELAEPREQPGNCRLTWDRFKEAPIKSLLLVTVPLGVAAAKLEWPPWLIFWLNFLALIPISGYLGAATEDISSYTSEVIAGLLNATFGNVVEMMVAIMALIRRDIAVVQAALLGSILSNLLFVLGSCFTYAGSRRRYSPGAKGLELNFSSKAASTCTSLLLLASIALVLPTSMYHVMSMYAQDDDAIAVRDELILHISRATSVVIFFIYLQFLYFQLKSHKEYFDSGEGEEDEDEPKWSLAFAVVVLAASSVMTAFTADYLVGSIQGYSEGMNLSKDFISLILVASVGNIPEFYVTMMVASAGKLDLALTIAVGSSCQMALLVTPFAVLTGWAMGVPMTLDFHMLQIICLLLSVLTVSSVIQGGSATWLHGSLLVGSYVIIGMMFFFLPSGFKD
jgi:Ca2+:H+ antiporter